MANNFITNNEEQNSLKKRIKTLISNSVELKFLVGFFYFSGWEEVYQKLKENENIQLKILIGLQVSKLFNQMLEHAEQETNLSQDEHFENFMQSLSYALNNEQMDTQAFYNQISFFLKMLEEERLIIRKTEHPNHAKLYLFCLNEQQRNAQDMQGQIVTGSSNLTRSGLSGQGEFNVEIKDYGYEEAEAYFDDLWDRAIPITEVDERKDRLKGFIQRRSQVANVTPYEAYALVLKTYLELQEQKQIRPEVEQLLEEKGYKKYSYQLDAVNQALNMINTYNGVIIADVVGLGKSIIASLIAKNLGQRGMVICPPGLMGNKMEGTGWYGYIEQFRLYDWEVESRGRIRELADHINEKNVEVVIIDEAHYYRNQDTEDYEALQNICRERKVILLTATPFNNSPADIFALLKLFLVPGQSGITLEDDLEALFKSYNHKFEKLGKILKDYKSNDSKKATAARETYKEIIDDQLPVQPQKVRERTGELGKKVKDTIAEVVIRRNRIDLKEDRQYAEEIDELPEVEDPRELFFELTPEQNEFYDRIIYNYFIDGGNFTGAIYKPFIYENIIEEDELDEEGNRIYRRQQNLYHFMTRLLVKRFESSFGSFSESIDRFLNVHKIIANFIEKTGGRYILDRDLIQMIYEEDEESIQKYLERYEEDLLTKKTKDNKVYDVNKFELKDNFLKDIEKDTVLFESIQKELKKLDMIQNDPKRDAVTNEIQKILKGDKNRKVVIFTEYVDTVHHLKDYLDEQLEGRLLVCAGKMTKKLNNELYANFDAQYKGEHLNDYDVLLTSDKLAEGFNLNRAGVIINYDIPWNPTKVIQRVGRINRIGTKVFDNLYIYNFFPSEKGADVVRSREIAEQKMYLIHNALGEDARMFDEDEVPEPSALFDKVNQNPYEEEEVNISTIVRNEYKTIQEEHPEVIEKIGELPRRVKTAKSHENAQLNVLRRKGLSLFSQVMDYEKSHDQVKSISFGEFLPLVRSRFDTKRKDLSEKFWPAYEKLKSYQPKYRNPTSELSLDRKALKNLKIGLKMIDPGADSSLNEFMKTLIDDIKNYHSLSTNTLGRMGRIKFNKNQPESENAKDFFRELRWIRNHLGDDYLDKILKRTEGQKSEVIIAVENRD